MLLVTSDDAVMKSRLKDFLLALQEELDDHRQSINENTNEIQSNFEILKSLQQQISVLTEKLNKIVQCCPVEKKPKISPLNPKEKQVFFALYSLGESMPFVSYKDLAKKTGFNDALVSSYITNMVEKGVPITKKYDAGSAFVQLAPDFRQLQAKENVIGVNTLLTYWF